jgi:hypothetical protein
VYKSCAALRKTGTVFGLVRVKSEDMLPVWFFLVLIVGICYLLYITRTTEEDIVVMSKNQIKRLHYWMRENAPSK